MTPADLVGRLPTHRRRLDNGLTVIVREDHSAPVVAVVTHVRAGYFDEPDTLVGISHVLEHMYFKGTDTREAGAIARETKAAGGYLNAGTIYDRTTYYTVLPAASLEQALDIQADALQRSAIDDDELRKELLVIIQEAKRKLDNPTAVAQEALFETMFDVHRMRRWRIGTEAMLSGFTRDDVWQYYRNLYRAANTIVVIAGDVEADRAFELAERHYGDMPAGEPVRDEGPAEPHRRGFRYREIHGDIIQTYVELGWRTPGTLHPDTPALDVLAVALGQGRASRLYRHVRDAGAAAAISAFNYTPTTLGVFGVGAELDPPDVVDALGRTGRVLTDVLAGGFSNAETERARNIIEAQFIRRLETAEGQATAVADWEALGDWRLADGYIGAVMGVTPENLQEVARRYLQPDDLTLLVHAPRAHQVFGHAPDAAERAHDALFGHAGAAGVIHAPAAAPDDAEGIAVAPAVRSGGRLRPERVEDGVHIYALSRGDARIVVKPRATAPLVSIALYCRGGVLAEGDGTAGLTRLTTRTSVKGTRKRSGPQLAEESEALGGTIGTAVGADLLDWSINIPGRHFERGLDLLLDAALEPAFQKDEAERERKIALSDLERMRDDMYAYPVRMALATGFPGHPYGFSPDLLERSFRALDVGSLTGWHRDRVLRGGPHVLAVGDIADPDVAAAAIAARLDGILEQPSGASPDPAVWVGGGAVAEERDKAQTSIVLAFPAPPRNHPDLYPLQLLSAAIAGLGGRLFEELRSRRSLAYAVSAAPVPRWLGGAFIAYIGTSPEREDEARSAMLAELSRTTTEPLEPDELARARRYMIGSWQIRQQTHARQLADLAYALLVGDGLRELREYETRMNAITAEDVRAAAERWLVEEAMVESVVRGTGGGR
ncbi:MAG TPA: pitrilysin family protein [Longimicrobiales bacterium]|nr:pitrilysin family protein [Longimicrobiales bacterium]